MVLAELEQDVHIFAVLKEVLKVAHIRMLDTPVDLDLTHELLLGATLGQRRLLDDFRCVHKHRLRIHELETFGEAALAQEFSFKVSADADFTILLFELFLHNRL